jgi:hypothetical protein
MFGHVFWLQALQVQPPVSDEVIIEQKHFNIADSDGSMNRRCRFATPFVIANYFASDFPS